VGRGAQLDCAIRLLEDEDLAAHTLAYAAYCLLRDLLGADAALRKLEKVVKLDEVPNFLKHADHHPEAFLNEHSPKTAHLTIRLAIRLWEDGKEQTELMREFCKRPRSVQAALSAQCSS
jgi:hypothetical protein